MTGLHTMAQSFNRSRRLYLADYDISCPRCLHAALLVLSLDGQPTYSTITIKNVLFNS